MLMSVKTSRSGFHRIVVPVFLAFVGFFVKPSFVPVLFSPFSKCRPYSKPSRTMVTSMYSEEYWVAQVPRPFRPSENS